MLPSLVFVVLFGKLILKVKGLHEQIFLEIKIFLMWEPWLNVKNNPLSWPVEMPYVTGFTNFKKYMDLKK